MGPSHFSHFPVYVDFIIETRRRATPATSAKLWRPTVCATGPSQQHMKQARGEGTRGEGGVLVTGVSWQPEQKCSLITLTIILAAVARLL